MYEKIKSLEAFKTIFKESTFEQLLKQAEIDVLGINTEESTVYGIDVAFHGAGLNYGSKEETAEIILKTIFRPLFDKLKISREKLAYIADSTSAPSKLLIPFNGWGAYIIGILTVQGIDKPFNELISAMKYNFYPLLVIIILVVIIISGKDFGLMKKAEKRTKGGILFDKGSTPMVSEDITVIKTKKGIESNSFNMFSYILFEKSF